MNQQKWDETAAKYGDNRWWESNDPRTRAYHQINEPIQMYGFDRFYQDFEALLGRPVWTHEFALCHDELRQEAEAAWKGTPYSVEGKQMAIQDGMDALNATGKAVYVVRADDETSA